MTIWAPYMQWPGIVRPIVPSMMVLQHSRMLAASTTYRSISTLSVFARTQPALIGLMDICTPLAYRHVPSSVTIYIHTSGHSLRHRLQRGIILARWDQLPYPTQHTHSAPYSSVQLQGFSYLMVHTLHVLCGTCSSVTLEYSCALDLT